MISSLAVSACCTPSHTQLGTSGTAGQPAPQASAPAAPDVAPPDPEASAPAPAPPAYLVQDTDTLRLEGTPDVPAKLRERMGQYLNTRRATLRDVSPDGKRVLIGTRFDQSTQVHLLTQPMGARTQITFADEPIAEAQFIPDAPRAILYHADIGGNEQHQLYRLDLDTGRSVRLTDASARNGAAQWSRGGKQLAFSSNARNKRDFDIWLSDGRTPESARKLVEGAGWWSALDWSFDDKSLLVGHYVSVTESHVYLVDVATGALSRVTPEGQPSANNAALFGRGADTVYVISDREGEFQGLYEVDRAGAKWRPLTRDIPWDVTDMALSSDGRTLAFTINDNGYDKLYLLDTRTRRSRPARGIPRGLITRLKFARKANVLGIGLSGATRMEDVFTYDVARGGLTQWTESEMGGLNAANFVEPAVVQYPTFDGRDIPALYYRPAGAGPFPVMISIHGGPEGQSRPWFSTLTQYAAAERGIAVVYPNVRGSTGYGKTYVALDNADKREDSVKDIGALLDWIKAQPELDAGRVCVYGGSYGGYMVLASLVHYSDRLACGVDVVGISNFVTFLENTQDYRRDLRRVEYGDERDPAMRAHLEKISPTTNVDKIRTPLFVAQGANDPRVPASEGEQIVAAVRGAGQDVWYMLAKNEGHGFRKKDNSDLFLLLSVLFMEKHLGVAE